MSGPLKHTATFHVLFTIVCSSLLTVTGVSLAQEEPEETAPEIHNLNALLSAAEAHYPALSADSFAIEAAEARLGQARFSPFFQWEATAGLTLAPASTGTVIFSDQGQLPFDGWGPALGVNVQGVIPLYTFGKILAVNRAARAGVSAARADRERTIATLRRDVRRAYYGLQLALDIEQMIREGRGRLDSAVRRLDEMLEEGDSSVNPMDRRRLAAAIAEIDARASETTRLRESSMAGLRMLTGINDIQVPDCPMSRAPLDEQNLESLIEASAARPERRMLDAAVEAREAALRIARARYAPDIGLAFRAGITWTPGRTNQDNPWVVDPGNQPSLGAGILMRWNLDFAGTTFRSRRAEAQLEETRADVELAQDAMNLEVELALATLEDAQRRELAWGNGRREGRAWFIAAAQGYDVGTVEPRELIEALKGYFEARFNHLRALMEFNLAAAELVRVSGSELIDGEWEPPCD